MAASEFAWLDGELVGRESANPSVASNTLHLGIAVFDGIMAYWNSDHWYVHRGREHLERFVLGAMRMDMELRWGVSEMEAGIRDLLETLPRETHYVRPIAYRRGPEVFFDTEDGLPSACIFAVAAARDVDTAHSCQLSPIQRVSHQAIPATWKVSRAYANSYRAEHVARAAGFDTGVMLDTRGRVAEAATANVFFLHGSTLATPKLDGDVFPGITRSIVIDITAGMGLDVQERDVWPNELGTFDAAMLCGTLSELRPISQLGQHRYGSVSNRHVSALIDRFRSITHQ
jgi:branched-chain amino acid aminotransferase